MGWAEKLQTPMQRWSMEEYRVGFSEAGFKEVEQLELTNTGGVDSEEDGSGTLCTYGVR